MSAQMAVKIEDKRVVTKNGLAHTVIYFKAFNTEILVSVFVGRWIRWPRDIEIGATYNIEVVNNRVVKLVPVTG